MIRSYDHMKQRYEAEVDEESRNRKIIEESKIKKVCL